MAGKVENKQYIAVGLSRDKLMGKDLVTSCYYDNGDVEVESGYLPGKSYRPFKSPQYKVQVAKREYNDGVLFCEVSRPSDLKINDTLLWGNVDMDLDWPYNDEYHIFLAHGDYRNGFFYTVTI